MLNIKKSLVALRDNINSLLENHPLFPQKDPVAELHVADGSLLGRVVVSNGRRYVIEHHVVIRSLDSEDWKVGFIFRETESGVCYSRFLYYDELVASLEPIPS